MKLSNTLLFLLLIPSVFAAEYRFDVFVDNVEDLAGAQVGVAYNTDSMTFVRIDDGDFLTQGGAETLTEFVADDGVLSEIVVVRLSSLGGVSGSGWLFTIVFDAPTTPTVDDALVSSVLLSNSQGLETFGSVFGSLLGATEVPVPSSPSSGSSASSSSSSGGSSLPPMPAVVSLNSSASVALDDDTPSRVPEKNGLVFVAFAVVVLLYLGYLLVTSMR